MATKMYSVKVKLSLNGFRNKFFQGISIAESPQKAQDLAIDYTLHSVIRGNPHLSDILSRDNIKATKCEKVKDDFYVNQETYKV